ncbi:MAG: Mth938-like domain-containing protein [Coriobacteriia bacterium]
MHTVADYRFGQATVDGEKLTSDFVVLPSRVVRGWRRHEGHRLAVADLEPFMEELPERLIVGTGAWGQVQVAEEVAATLMGRGVEMVVATTPDAVRLYGESDPSRTALAVHLTC